MLSKQSNHQPAKLLLVLLLLILTSSVLIGVLLIKQHELVYDEVSHAPTVAIKRPIYVQLPGAEKILALKEDYLKDDSLWRVVKRDLPLQDINYRPKLELAKVATRTDKSSDERSVRLELQTPLQTMFAAADAANYKLMIGSGFRSAELQSLYYNNFLRASGQAYADKISARPGTSEHQLGLAVDLSYVSKECYLENCFNNTAAGKWLAANAYKYGFILRYPENKTNITGYQFEPWHFRYVGVDLATALFQSGLTLDEANSYLLAARLKLGYKTNR